MKISEKHLRRPRPSQATQHQQIEAERVAPQRMRLGSHGIPLTAVDSQAALTLLWLRSGRHPPGTLDGGYQHSPNPTENGAIHTSAHTITPVTPQRTALDLSETNGQDEAKDCIWVRTGKEGKTWAGPEGEPENQPSPFPSPSLSSSPSPFPSPSPSPPPLPSPISPIEHGYTGCGSTAWADGAGKAKKDGLATQSCHCHHGHLVVVAFVPCHELCRGGDDAANSPPLPYCCGDIGLDHATERVSRGWCDGQMGENGERIPTICCDKLDGEEFLDIG